MIALRIISTIIMSLLMFMFSVLCVDKDVSKPAKYLGIFFLIGSIFTLVTLWVL